jgi:hypothetical protein
MTTTYRGNQQVPSGYYLDTARFTVAPIAADGDALPAGPGSWRRIPTALALLLTPVMGLAFLLFLPLAGFLVAAQAALAPVVGLLHGSAGELAATMTGRQEPGQAHLAGQLGSTRPAGPGADDGLEPLLREIQRRRRLA